MSPTWCNWPANPMGTQPSASKSALILSPCLAWARIGAAGYDESRVDLEDTSARDNGTEFHRLMDEYYRGNLWPVVPVIGKT